MKGETQEYLGARGIKFHLFPGSSLYKKLPRWVMALVLTETARLYARTAARIEPEWVERRAPHLVKRHYSEPRWEKKAAAVMANERVTLYGLPVVMQRKVQYGHIDPVEARVLFIRHALVKSKNKTHTPNNTQKHTQNSKEQDHEHKERRHDI